MDFYQRETKKICISLHDQQHVLVNIGVFLDFELLINNSSITDYTIVDEYYVCFNLPSELVPGIYEYQINALNHTNKYIIKQDSINIKKTLK